MTLNNSKIRQYVPEPGTLVKMGSWDCYAQRDIPIWSWLRVVSASVDEQICTVRIASHPTDANQDSEPVVLPLVAIEPPIGWEPRYTICANPEQARKIVDNWFSRGIVVRANHEIGSPHGSAFQPLDNSGTPHWRYPEITDTIQPQDCPRLIRVVAVEEEEITSATLEYPADPKCTRCNGTGRRPLQHLAKVRNETMEQLLSEIESLQLADYTPVDQTFRCHCHTDVLSRMGRTRRAKLFKEMTQQGWKVRYIRYNYGFWMRTRETVIHDWEE